MKNTDYYDMILTGEQKTMLFQKKNPLFTYIFTVIFSVSILIQASFPVLAAPEETPDATGQAAQERLQLPVQTNELAFWPKGPAITAQSAILMEAETGTILYAKNIHEELYPASTTKMLTCLIAVENCALNETVNFTYEAVSAVPGDGSNMGMDAGEYITMEECLYGIMVASANEVANAVGEHVAGSLDGFAEMMNKRAAELGCQNTHFINANGLHAEDHYTSAYDLALIARAYFQNDVLRRIGNTASYHFIPSAGQPDDFYKTNKHGLINGTYSYEGIIGGKTGYTDNAGQTLVTGCEQAGMRLICVVMKEDSRCSLKTRRRCLTMATRTLQKPISLTTIPAILSAIPTFSIPETIFSETPLRSCPLPRGDMWCSRICLTLLILPQRSITRRLI